MIQIFKSTEQSTFSELIRTEQIENGTWINLIKPTEAEIQRVHQELNIPLDYISSALDEEERSRIESDEEDYKLILIDIPIITTDEHEGFYGTIPLGIIIGEYHIVTVCLCDNPILNDFATGKVKNFHTFKKTRFLFQILFKNSTYYLHYLRNIDRKSEEIEKELHRSMKNKELIQLLRLEKSLVYFSTSLKGNEVILEKIMRTNLIKMYEEDQEILEDVIVENKQAIEMSNIYSNILGGTMDAYASVISNNLNIVMKFLASITIVLSIPTMVASFFGMNVMVPLKENTYGFVIIVLISFVISGILGFTMMKKNLF